MDISSNYEPFEQPSRLGTRLYQGRLRPATCSRLRDSPSDGALKTEKSFLFDGPDSPSKYSWAGLRHRRRFGDTDETEVVGHLPRLKSTGDLIERSSKLFRSKCNEAAGNTIEKSKSSSVGAIVGTRQALKDASRALDMDESAVRNSHSRGSARIQKAKDQFLGGLADVMPTEEGLSRDSHTSGASRIERAREQFLGECARTLDWSIDVQHETVRSIRAQLCVSTHKTVKSVGGEDVPACLIEVSAEGFPTAGATRGSKLVRCSGSLIPRYSRLHINWLGRKGARPDESDFENAGKAGLELGSKDKANGRADKEPRHQTIAQAVFATVAGIARLFGVVTVDLDAEDNGSGKLVQYYTELGFKVKQHIPGFDIEMEAPMSTVIQYAPAEWLRGLVPSGFHAWAGCSHLGLPASAVTTIQSGGCCSQQMCHGPGSGRCLSH